jgi:hypothetical protein
MKLILGLLGLWLFWIPIFKWIDDGKKITEINQMSKKTYMKYIDLNLGRAK